MRLLNPAFASKRHVEAALAGLGFVAGAMLGLVLTIFGKIVTGAPFATTGNYMWNAAAFGITSAVLSPTITWSFLRYAPLWRTALEPLSLAIFGGAVGVLTGSPLLFVVLPPLGLAAGFIHLHGAYRRQAEVAFHD